MSPTSVTSTLRRLAFESLVTLVAATACLGAALAQETAAVPQTQGSADAGRAKAATCTACHGPDGNSVTPNWPSLAGQHPEYIARQIKAFKNGERKDVTMMPFAQLLSDQDVLDVAAYFAAQKPAPKGADPALVSLGQQIYRGGVPTRGIPACIACHGPRGHGNPFASYPRIGWQHSAYVTKALQDYKGGERASDGANQMMRNVASLLKDDEIRALASYVQGLD